MVGAPGGVALNGPDMQHAGQTTSVEEILTFQSFELTVKFLARKELYHLYCQTERMFSRELLPESLDKGKATQVMHLQMLSGSCLQAPL